MLITKLKLTYKDNPMYFEDILSTTPVHQHCYYSYYYYATIITIFAFAFVISYDFSIGNSDKGLETHKKTSDFELNITRE